MQALAQHHQISPPDLIREGLHDGGIKLATIQHPAQGKAHADAGSHRDLRMQTAEPTEDA